METKLPVHLSRTKKAVLGVGLTMALPMALGLSLPFGNNAAQAATASCGERDVHPVQETHTLPPYPSSASIKAKEQGKTLLQVVIGKDGRPAAVRTVKSSGFADLDESGARHVSANWRWEPLRKGCSSITTRIGIVWDWRDVH